MRTKIVTHIAGNARHELMKAIGEAKEMVRKYPQMANTTDQGPGLDLAVLKEHLDRAANLVDLLA